MGSFYSISECPVDRSSPIDLPIFSVVGYGDSKEDSLQSLNCCIQYNHGVELKKDSNGSCYIISKKGLIHYAYVSEQNGVFKCYLK